MINNNNNSNNDNLVDTKNSGLLLVLYRPIAVAFESDDSDWSVWGLSRRLVPGSMWLLPFPTGLFTIPSIKQSFPLSVTSLLYNSINLTASDNRNSSS